MPLPRPKRNKPLAYRALPSKHSLAPGFYCPTPECNNACSFGKSATAPVTCNKCLLQFQYSSELGGRLYEKVGKEFSIEELYKVAKLDDKLKSVTAACDKATAENEELKAKIQRLEKEKGMLLLQANLLLRTS